MYILRYARVFHACRKQDYSLMVIYKNAIHQNLGSLFFCGGIQHDDNPQFILLIVAGYSMNCTVHIGIIESEKNAPPR